LIKHLEARNQFVSINLVAFAIRLALLQIGSTAEFQQITINCFFLTPLGSPIPRPISTCLLESRSASAQLLLVF